MDLKRDVYESMVEWAKGYKKVNALFLKGPRRVGKSYLADKLGKEHFSSYIHVDFTNEVERKPFMNFRSLDELFFSLQSNYGKRLYENKSLIILDEIQFCPEARSLIKPLVADGRFSYIETGSILGILNKDKQKHFLPSEEHDVNIYPLNFKEFCYNTGNEEDFNNMAFAVRSGMSLPEGLHLRMMQLFKAYLVVGGMPKVVETFIESGKSGNLNTSIKVEEIKQDILNLYVQDIGKYSGEEQRKVREIFDFIPSQLGKPNNRFFLNALNTSFDTKMRNFSEPLDWLRESKTVYECANASDFQFNLTVNAQRPFFKLYMADIGLLVTKTFWEESQRKEDMFSLISKNIGVNFGMLIENFVADELASNNRSLFYYSRKNKQMEADFLLRKNLRIYPLEVKSANRFTINSLKKIKETYGKLPIFGRQIVLYPGNSKIEDGIFHLPLYACGVLFGEDDFAKDIKSQMEILNYGKDKAQSMPWRKEDNDNIDLLDYYQVNLGSSPSFALHLSKGIFQVDDLNTNELAVYVDKTFGVNGPSFHKRLTIASSNPKEINFIMAYRIKETDNGYVLQYAFYEDLLPR